MNRRLTYIISTLMLLVLFSCRKETSIERPGSTDGTFMADVNGSQWVASDSLKSASILAGLINLTGISDDHRQLSITLNDTIPGIYVLNQNSTSVAFFGYTDSSSSYIYSTNQGADSTQAGGTVTVTEIDPINHTISGTFSFNVYREFDGKQLQFTNGIFRKLPYTSSLPPGDGSDTLKATIDGGNWVAQSVDGAVVSGQLIINGSNLSATQFIGLSMPANVIPGQYTLDYRLFTYYAAYVPSPNVALASSEGTLEILENDVANKRIRGNFTFKAVDPTDPQGLVTPPRQVTNGFFAVTYQ